MIHIVVNNQYKEGVKKTTQYYSLSVWSYCTGSQGYPSCQV